MLRLKSLSGISSFSQGSLCSKRSPLALTQCMKASAPLPDCSIDNALVHNDVMMMQLLQGKGRTGVVNFG